VVAVAAALYLQMLALEDLAGNQLWATE